MVKLGKSSLRKAIFESQRGSRTRSTNSSRRPLFKAAIRDEQGQVLVWVALGMVLFLAASAFALDLGHAYLVRKQLQSSTDAAALAAAWHITDGTYDSVATTYGATGTLNNYSQGYTVDTPITVTPKCSTTVASWGLTCNASATPPTYNMVTVQEVAHVPTFFAGVIGFKTLTVTTTSAASKGARPTPFNIAFVLDTTYSMRLNDPSCGNITSMACAENAIGTILTGLDPTQDDVSMFTFPAFEYDPSNPNTNNDNNCSGKAATGEPYAFPSTTATSLTQPTLTTTTTTGTGSSKKTTTTTIQETYQISDFSDSYISSYGASSLTSGDPIVNAIGQSKSCSGVQVNSTQNTYLAATIYQAAAALEAEQSARLTAGTQSANAMIIFSDGNATTVDNSTWQDMTCTTTGGYCPTQTSTNGVNPSDTTGAYPSLVGECGQEVDAAQAFNNFNSSTLSGILVFSIAYGSPNSSTGGGKYGNGGNCGSDVSAGKHPNITPCEAMQDMSTGWDQTPQDQSNFYTDDNAPGGDPTCTGANSAISNLSDIAQAILSKLSETRLIPPDTP
ncbi:MAG: pilus assembly protein TadG-related protein [Terracidiphilus sp.]